MENCFFRHIKKLPAEGTDEYKKLALREIERCKKGVMIKTPKGKKFYLSGWMYFHYNFFKMNIDYTDPETGLEEMKLDLPDLRDTDLIISDAVTKASYEKKGLCIAGSRRLGKTSFSASYMMQGALFYKGTTGIIAGLSNPDLGEITNKCSMAYENLWKAFRTPRSNKDWSKEIIFGTKTKSGDLDEWSRIKIRNLDEGKNTEALAGPTPSRLIIDEFGKGDFGSPFEGAKPSFISKNGGWRFVPILTGCVCAGTKVWNNKGELVNIEDLYQNDGILGYDGNSCVKQNITHMNHKSKKNCVRITTTNNNQIECSVDHPFLTSNKRPSSYSIYKYSFVKAEDLIVGQHLAVINNVPFFGKIDYNYDYLIGLMIGDGHFKGSTLSIDDINIKNFITNNYNYYIKKSFITKNNNEYTELGLNGLKSEFINLDLYDKTGEHKRLPKITDKLSKNSLSKLLAGIFDADGNINFNRTKQIVNKIVLTSISIELLNDVKYQLIKFGIHSSIRKEKRKNKGFGKSDYIYRLYITKDKDIELFRDNIPLKHSRKIKTLSLFKKGNRDVGCPKAVFKLTNSHSDEIFIEDNSEISNFKFETIKKIEPLGEREIYNLTTETHTYLANGFITHNTGGSFTKPKDAKKYFFHPEENNFLAFNKTNSQTEKCGLFISGEYRFDFKYKSNLDDFLEREESRLFQFVPPYEVEEIEMDLEVYVSDRKKAREVLADEYSKGSAISNVEYLKARMYGPLVEDDIFLTENANPFADLIPGIKLHIEYLKSPMKDKIYDVINVDLYKRGNQVHHMISNKVPVQNFPHQEGDNIHNPPVCVLAGGLPKEGGKYRLEVLGCDPYNVNQSDYTASLGAIYVIRQRNTDLTDIYQEWPVAWYVGRPNKLDDFYKIAELMIEWYGGKMLHENSNQDFLGYFDRKFKAHYLVDTPQLQKEIFSASRIKSTKGLAPTPKNQDFLVTLVKRELEKEIPTSQGTMMGFETIPDPLLLQEIIQFGEVNTDRFWAYAMALANKYLHEKFINGGIVIEEDDEEPQEERYVPFLLQKRRNSIVYRL